MNRRRFLQTIAGAGLASHAGTALARSQGRIERLEVELVARGRRQGREIVNFGVPFAPGQLNDASSLQVHDAQGRSVEASVRALEPWRSAAGEDATPSIRAVQIQFPFDFTRGSTAKVHVSMGTPGAAKARFVPVAETLVDADGREGPRVLAVLPARWLCDSQISGPQTPARESGRWSDYDRFVERSFSGSLRYLDSDVYHHWLFDRTSVYYKQYIRTGDRRFLEAAQHCAEFVRSQTEMAGPDAGFFKLKGPDVKYVYPRAMHLHYLLTGDERALEAGKVMARYCLSHWDPVYRPDAYTRPPLGDDPEKARAFWSPRHQAYGMLGVLHGWEMTGEPGYWRKIIEYADALASHQAQPPDGLPADGSWRQNWALYDPNETLLPAATSPWMTAILVDALFHYWWTSRDARVPGMVTRWCDFLDRRGFTPDGAHVHYVVDCTGSDHLDDAPGPQEQGIERHSTELAYTFAMGQYFSRDPAQRVRFRRRFDRLFEAALSLDANRPERCYNWAFQASGQLVYFMQHLDAVKEATRAAAAPS